MATSASIQKPDTSYDANAVSIVVSDRSSSDARPGSFFSSDFAAVSPVHFHPLGDGKVMGVFAKRWHGATRPENSNDPNLFEDYEVDELPSWTIFDQSNGNHYSIPGQSGINTPASGTYSSRVAVGGCSRTNSYVYLLQSVVKGGVTSGLISHYHINPVTWQVNLLGEEELASVQLGSETVTFNLGVKHNITYLTFVGKNSLGQLFLARKNWGFIGSPGAVEYQGERGWSEDPSNLFPLKSSSGFLTSAGPVSMAEHQKRTFMSVVEEDDGEMSARIYTSVGLWDAWSPLNHPYPLGTQGSSYLGGTAYLQQALRANPLLLSTSGLNGIPLVYALKRTSEGGAAISIKWDLWPITVPGASRSIAGDASLDASVAPTASWQ